MDEVVVKRALELSEGEKCIAVHFPLEGESALLLAVSGKEGVKAVGLAPLGESGEEIVDQILSLDEASQKLWENFRTTHEEIATHFLTLKVQEGVSVTSFGYLLWVISALLWLSQEEIKLSQTLAKVGLKVDTPLVKGEGIALLQTPKLLRSLMSYKIAGVGNGTLLFSLYESLADFVIDALGMLNETFHSRVVVFSGEVASHPLVKERLEHRLGRRYKLMWA